MTPESARGWAAAAKDLVTDIVDQIPRSLDRDGALSRDIQAALEAAYAAGHAAGVVEERARWEAARRAAPPTPNP